MNLVVGLAAAKGAVVVIRCARCQCLRCPGPDTRLALCRRCLAEVEDIFSDPTPVGPVLGASS